MKRRLLVIDDNDRFARTVARMAGLWGYGSEQCSDPTQALDAFLALRPDVIMVDMCMPEKDGIEVVDEILLTGLSVGIIFTSGYGTALLHSAMDVAKYHRHPHVALLGKPFRREELAATLQRVYEASAAPAAVRELSAASG